MFYSEVGGFTVECSREGMWDIFQRGVLVGSVASLGNLDEAIRELMSPDEREQAAGIFDASAQEAMRYDDDWAAVQLMNRAKLYRGSRDDGTEP